MLGEAFQAAGLGRFAFGDVLLAGTTILILGIFIAGLAESAARRLGYGASLCLVMVAASGWIALIGTGRLGPITLSSPVMLLSGALLAMSLAFLYAVWSAEFKDRTAD